MPRLTNADYLLYRSELFLVWDDMNVFGRLSAQDQWILHGYFVPTKQISAEEAIAHRKAVSRAIPSLPNRAGKVMRKVQLLQSIDWIKVARPPQDAGPRHLTLRSIVRPEPDLDQIARSMISLAIEAAERGTRLPGEPPSDDHRADAA